MDPIDQTHLGDNLYDRVVQNPMAERRCCLQITRLENRSKKN